MLRSLMATAMFLSLGATEVIAQDASCVEAAKTIDDVVNCGNVVVPAIEERINKEFNRIAEKYKNNDEMQTMIRLTKDSWSNYRNIQCNFEGDSAADGQTRGALPVKGQKAFLGCVVRTLHQMESALSKL